MAKDKTTISRGSATITGIPVAGAIGGGDESDKLGRPRRYPFYHDERGSPSMSADSTFSTHLGRVNKGWDLEEIMPMFPEQEEPEENNYDIDDSDILPPTSKIPRQTVPRVVREDEDKMKRLKLSEILTDEFYLDDNLNEITAWKGAWDATKSVGADVAGDLSMALIGSVPVIGDFIAGSAALFNVAQMNGTMNRSKGHIVTFLQSPNQNSRNLLEDDLDDLITDLIDFVQRSLEALPDPGASEIGSAGISLVSNLARLRFGKIGYEAWRKAKVAKGALSGFKGVAGPLPRGAAEIAATGAKVQKYTGLGGSGVGASAKVAVITEPITRYISGIFNSDFVPEDLKNKSDSVIAVPVRMQLLADLIDDYDSQVAAWYDNGVRPERFDADAMYRSRVDVNPASPGEYQHSGNVISRPIPTMQQSLGDGSSQRASSSFMEHSTAGITRESKKINKKETKMKITKKQLRQFILESINLEEMDLESPYHPELGFGAEYPPYQLGKDSEISKNDYVDEFLVQLKADDGVITGQHRTNESHLRQFIREAVKEEKKKIMKHRR